MLVDAAHTFPITNNCRFMVKPEKQLQECFEMCCYNANVQSQKSYKIHETLQTILSIIYRLTIL